MVSIQLTVVSPWLAIGQEYNQEAFCLHMPSILQRPLATSSLWPIHAIEAKTYKFRPALHWESGSMFNPNLAFLLVQKLKSAPRALYQESRLKMKITFLSAPSYQHLLVTWGQTTSQKTLKVGPKLFCPDSQCKGGLQEKKTNLKYAKSFLFELESFSISFKFCKRGPIDWLYF